MLTPVKVSTKKDGSKREAVFQYDIPVSLQEALDTAEISPGPNAKFTLQQVYEEFVAGFKVTLQAPARKALESAPFSTATTEEEQAKEYSSYVQSKMSIWKLGDKATRAARSTGDTIAAIAAEFHTYTEERKQEIAAMFGLQWPGMDSSGGNGAEEEGEEEAEEVEEEETSPEEEEAALSAIGRRGSRRNS